MFDRSAPAFRPFFLLCGLTLLAFHLAGVFRTEVAPGDEAQRRQEEPKMPANDAAASALRRHQRTSCPAAPTRRARIGSPARSGADPRAGRARKRSAYRLLSQTMQANGDQVARHTGLEPARGEGLLAEQPADDVHRRGSVEGRPAGEQFVQDDAQRIHVRGRAGLPQAAIGLLRGHVAAASP